MQSQGCAKYGGNSVGHSSRGVSATSAVRGILAHIAPPCMFGSSSSSDSQPVKITWKLSVLFGIVVTATTIQCRKSP